MIFCGKNNRDLPLYISTNKWYHCYKGNDTIFVLGVRGMTSQEIVSMAFQLALTGGLGIIAYFLKRVMDELDRHRSEIDRIKTSFISKDEFDKCKTDITEVKQNYLTKEDFYREQLKTETKLDKIMDILMVLKGEK